MFRAGCCTHSVGGFVEKRSPQCHMKRINMATTHRFFFFFSTCNSCPPPRSAEPPNPSPTPMSSHIHLCPGHVARHGEIFRYVMVAHLPSLSLLTSLLTCPCFHPPHALTCTHTFRPLHALTPAHTLTPCTPACALRPCSIPTPHLRHPRPPTTPTTPIPRSRHCHPPAPPQRVQTTSAN